MRLPHGMKTAAFLLASCWASDAAAEETLLLRYRAPVECPDGAAFRGEIRALLEAPETAARKVPVEVVIEGDVTTGYSLHLELPSGERSLEGARCPDLVRAAALFVALLLEDPKWSTPASPPEEAPAREPALAPEPEPSSPLRLYLGASAGVDTGSLPAPGPLFSLHMGGWWERLALEARVFGIAPQQGEVDAFRSLEAALVGGGMSGCHIAQPVSTGLFSLCGGASGGALFASSPEILAAGEATPGFFNLDLSAGYWFLVEDTFALTLQTEMSQPLVAPTVYLRGTGEPVLAHRLATTFRGTAGMRWFF